MIDTCYVGDVCEGLRAFHAAGLQAQTCVTSPPYWGLRDYGVAGQIGLEPTIGEYLERMVAVFREIRRVLRDDGTAWVNMGDCYATGTSTSRKSGTLDFGVGTNEARNAVPRMDGRSSGLKPKDLCGIPWRLAFALQDDGWWLRRDIIWHKKNPMPESCSDRPTTSHEYLFLLAKSERYFYDADAIKEPCSEDTHARRSMGDPGFRGQITKPVAGWANDSSDHSPVSHAREKGDGDSRKMRRERKAHPGNGVGFGNGSDRSEPMGRGPGWRVKDNDSFHEAMADQPAMRNKRSVWTIATEPFKEAHFATFPTALVEPCILAGSRPGDIVLDPFMGSGTTAMVAQSLGRRWIGCELNPQYVAMQARRTAQAGMELA